MPLVLDPIQSGYNLSKINDNFQRIEDTWDEKLDRVNSGSFYNQMDQTLDMNSNEIINTKVTDNPTSLVTKEYVDANLASLDGVQGVIPLVQVRQQGDGSTLIFSSPATAPTPNNSFFVQIDGITQRPLTDFSANATGDIVFSEAPPLLSDVDITYFEPVSLGDVVSQSYVDQAIHDSEDAIFSDLSVDLEMSPQASVPVLGTETYIVIDDGSNWSGVNTSGLPRPVFYDGTSWHSMV